MLILHPTCEGRPWNQQSRIINSQKINQNYKECLLSLKELQQSYNELKQVSETNPVGLFTRLL